MTSNLYSAPGATCGRKISHTPHSTRQRIGCRELVIGRRAHGYLALYRYVAEIDTVIVLAVRSQREAGYVERGG